MPVHACLTYSWSRERTPHAPVGSWCVPSQPGHLLNACVAVAGRVNGVRPSERARRPRQLHVCMWSKHGSSMHCHMKSHEARLQRIACGCIRWQTGQVPIRFNRYCSTGPDSKLYLLKQGFRCTVTHIAQHCPGALVSTYANRRFVCMCASCMHASLRRLA